MGAIFKLAPEPTFRVLVPIPVPGGTSVDLDLEFRHKTRDGIKAWLSGLGGHSDAEHLHEVIVAWHNCETSYSQEALDTLLQNYPQAATVILAAYTRELTGARLGN